MGNMWWGTRGRACNLFSFPAFPAPSPKQLSLPILLGVRQHPPSLALPAPSSDITEVLAMQPGDVSLLLRLRDMAQLVLPTKAFS